MQVRGSVVLITGASEGIGAACARELARRGARLSVTARSEEKLRAAGGPDALVTAGDLTDAGVRRRVVERTLERYGRIDALINNAGVGLYVPAWKAPPAATRRMFELNLFAALELIQLVVPDMIQRRRGAVVNVSSIAGQVPLPWLTLYSASKAALIALGRGLRMELKPHGIQVTTVCPGYVKTGFPEHAVEGRPPEALRRQWRFGISAERCARTIARALERHPRTAMAPPTGWALVAADRLAPAAVEWKLGRIARSLEHTE